MRQHFTRNIQSGLMAVPLLFAPVLMAQTPIADLRTSVLETPSTSKKWSLPITLESASSLHQKNAYERKVQQSLTLLPTYNISETYKVSLRTSIYKDDSNNEDGGTTAFDNTRLSLSGSHAFLNDAAWTYGVASTFATDQTLRQQTSYQGALRASTGLNLNELPLGSSLQYTLSFTRNFHEFNMNADGEFNVRETIGNTLDLSVPLYGPVSLQTTFVYSAGKTYSDDLRTKFSTEANLVWQVNQELSVAAGSSNEGNALGPNGVDSNIEFFNDNSSLVKLGLTYIL